MQFKALMMVSPKLWKTLPLIHVHWHIWHLHHAKVEFQRLRDFATVLQIEAKTQSQTWALRGHEGKRSTQKLTDGFLLVQLGSVNQVQSWKNPPGLASWRGQGQVGIKQKKHGSPKFALTKKKVGIHFESFFFARWDSQIPPFLRRSTSWFENVLLLANAH